MNPATSGAGAAAAAAAHAIKVSGVIVRVEPSDFKTLVGRMDRPLVVVAEKSFLSGGYRYLTSYKGLAFLTKSPEPIALPGGAEIVRTKSIWVP